jgi:diketogulonate reductase-like aldo/keto reductase
MDARAHSPGSGPAVDLIGGVRMPLLGCGTQYGFTEDGNARGAIDRAAEYAAQALRVGFRLLDTARGYGTEAAVLAGLAAATVPRRDAFVVTKAWVGVDHPPGLAASRAAVAESAARLGGYVDLFLVHQPVPGWQDLWRALEEAKDQGLVRAIGVSNFGVAQLEELVRMARHRPAANQIHLHPFVHERHRDTLAWCAEHGVRVIAFPRAPWRLGAGSAVDAVAAECGRTRAQVMLRWAVERGFAVIPLSTDPRHLAENFAVREFRLDREQVARIDRIADRPRIRYHVDRVDAQQVAGWAFLVGQPLRIRVLVGDRTIGEAARGHPRPDVQAAHAGEPDALASGFTFSFPAGCFGEGPREVRLSFEAADGERCQTDALPVPAS